MADHLTELPLFPLHAAMFPHAHVQLHVFEQRYRDLIEHCETYDVPFGVVLIKSGQETSDTPVTFDVGTTARIQKIHLNNDGRMHVVALGEQRFKIRSINDTRSFLMAQVEPVVESSLEGEDIRSEALIRRSSESFSMLIQSMLSRPDFNVDIQLPLDGPSLSFVIANFLELDNKTKQKLLEMTVTNDRLALLVPMIERQLLEIKTPTMQKLTSEDLKEFFNPN